MSIALLKLKFELGGFCWKCGRFKWFTRFLYCSACRFRMTTAWGKL